MSESPYVIRSYTPADFNHLFLFFQDAESLEPAGRPATPQAISEKLSWPDYSPEDNLTIVEFEGDIIGYMETAPELGIERVVIDCWLRPEHREKGIGKKLLARANARAKELGARYIHVNVRNDNLIAKGVLRKLGFQFVRRFLELKLDLDAVDRGEMEDAFCGCRHLEEGEEAMLTDIQNRSFTEHWGYNPNTVESITYRMNLSYHFPRDIILACEDGEVTGYCWTEVNEERQGRIYMIGSDPEYRGQGIGKKLLLAGLNYLRSRGVRDVWLSVDSENKVACSLYKSIGFEEHTTYLWYEKPVD